MEITKKTVALGDECQWNVTYHKTGEMIANSRWFDTEQEADDFISSITATN